jgi:sialic acid synthase SpsE
MTKQIKLIEEAGVNHNVDLYLAVELVDCTASIDRRLQISKF